ncbi:MAK10-like protein [Tanacetum coccineum]
MGDENPIRTLGDYSKPSHEGYRNTIEFPEGNNVDFLKLVDSLDIDGSITTWEDLTTRFLAQFFPLRRTAKLRNDIMMFQQHHGESLFEAWSLFKDLLQKVRPHGIDLWLQVQIFYDHVNPVTRRTIDQSVGAHLAPTQPTQVNKVTTSCEICSGPHDTQYCMEDPEQAFVEYASSRTDEPGGLVSNFMASQDARLSKFEADFKQQQSEMTNMIDTVLKAITDQIAGTLPSDMVKNPKLNASLVFSARSYPNMDPQCSNHVQGSINAIIIYSEKQNDSYDEKAKENEEEEKNNSENIHLELVPQSSDSKVVCTKGDNIEVMFIELIRKNDDSSEGEPEEEGSTTTERVGAEYFDIFPTRSELAYHKYLMCSLIPSIFLRNPIIIEGCPSNIKIPCNIGHVHVEKPTLTLTPL